MSGAMASPTPEDRWRDPDFEEAVRETAYFLWEADGRPEGREQDYWFMALERSLRERRADRDLRQEPVPGNHTAGK